MVENPPPARSQEDLIAEIALNRQELSAHRLGMSRAANVTDRLQRSFHDHAGLFFGSAIVLGALLSLIPAGTRSRREKSALKRAEAWEDEALHEKKKQSRSITTIVVGLLGKVALDLGKPVVLKMVREHLEKNSRASAPGPRP
ncbi:hypothetical protein [Brevifollis gellanilyticus]|uniref:Uncharacterized protein n=1 Tax=Brevifollis gellanilyticus TaxID=748831 RepID=A0A512M2G9_9BACT|nr:hypothetical protein [Brevifollis gellanilyticus]GEP40930.1 hypothetical protein BGE01nite_02210 [Brevifollis gellanilyticus]